MLPFVVAERQTDHKQQYWRQNSDKQQTITRVILVSAGSYTQNTVCKFAKKTSELKYGILKIHIKSYSQQSLREGAYVTFSKSVH